MKGLVGVIGAVIAFVDGLVADHADLMVMVAGGLADPLALIEVINGHA